MTDLESNLEKLDRHLARFKTNPLENRIDGQCLHAQSGETFENRSPIDGSAIGHVARSNTDDVNAAAQAAKAAFASWRDLDAP